MLTLVFPKQVEAGPRLFSGPPVCSSPPCLFGNALGYCGNCHTIALLVRPDEHEEKKQKILEAIGFGGLVAYHDEEEEEEDTAGASHAASKTRERSAESSDKRRRSPPPPKEKEGDSPPRKRGADFSSEDGAPADTPERQSPAPAGVSRSRSSDRHSSAAPTASSERSVSSRGAPPPAATGRPSREGRVAVFVCLSTW